MTKTTAAACALYLAAMAAHADEAKIRRAIEPKLQGARIEAVQPAPVPGLYEVRFRNEDGVQVLYTDASGKFVIAGDIYDSDSDRNLTEERRRKLSAISFDALPLDLAVKVKRGNGKRTLAVFADPYCPACRQFEHVLAETKDITIYYFMFPVIRPDLTEQSRAVWCAPDRAKAWIDLAMRHKPPSPAVCSDPINKILELGRSLRIASTPTLFFANGERVNGGLPPARLVKMLDEAGSRTGK
jgi:thiol:disulfide interchange protein DsbC